MRYPLLLTALLAFHGLNNYITLTRDTLPLYRDEAHKVRASLLIDDTLRAEGEGDFGSALRGLSYPPLPQISSVPLYGLFGRSIVVTRMTGLIFLAILAVSVYGIGATLHSGSAGFLAAFTVTMFPQIFAHSRIYMPDLPLCAATALSLCLLIQSREMTRAIPLAGFGLSLGLGLLSKWIYPVFVAGPASLYLIRSWTGAGLKKRQRNRMLLLSATVLIPAAAVGLSIAGLWYLLAKDVYLNHITNVMAHSNLRGLEEQGILEFVLYYFRDFYRVQMLDGFFVLFVASLAFLAVKRPPGGFWLIIWIAVPYLFFTFVVEHNKSPRYLMSVLPAAALSISLMIHSIPKKALRAAAVWSAVAFGLVQYVVLCFFPDYSHAFEHGLALPILGAEFGAPLYVAGGLRPRSIHPGRPGAVRARRPAGTALQSYCGSLRRPPASGNRDALDSDQGRYDIRAGRVRQVDDLGCDRTLRGVAEQTQVDKELPGGRPPRLAAVVAQEAVLRRDPIHVLRQPEAVAEQHFVVARLQQRGVHSRHSPARVALERDRLAVERRLACATEDVQFSLGGAERIQVEHLSAHSLPVEAGPGDAVAHVVDDILRGGKAHGARLGVQVQVAVAEAGVELLEAVHFQRHGGRLAVAGRLGGDAGDLGERGRQQAQPDACGP